MQNSEPKVSEFCVFAETCNSVFFSAVEFYFHLFIHVLFLIAFDTCSLASKT